jgi:hypothetical protein
MATFNLVVTYPDAQQTRILNALKTHWAVDGVVPSNAEVVEQLRLVVAANVRDIVLKVERDAAVIAAADSVTPVTVS